jgi:hypothetical protein
MSQNNTEHRIHNRENSDNSENLIVLRLFHLVSIVYCGCFVICGCVYVGFVMCGCVYV